MTLRATGVSFAYEREPVVSGVSLTAHPGEVLGLLGPNGSGKSTLLGLLAGHWVPQSGVVTLDGRPLAGWRPDARARRLAWVEQGRAVGFDFTVREVVAWGRLPHRGHWDRWRARDEAAVRRALRATGLTGFADRPLRTLSGGERQRAFLALALAQEPDVLLLDEPTAHLDLKHQLEALERVAALARGRGLAAVVALHDLNLAARACDRVLVLDRGRPVACAPPADALTEDCVASVWGVEVQVIRRGADLWIVPAGGRLASSQA